MVILSHIQRIVDMNKIDNILDKVGGKTGYTVPDNYFDNVRTKILSELPEYKERTPEKISMWRRVSPYLYMAAMFAGIWCMMKMFGILSGPAPDLTDINNYPGVMTALNDTKFVDDYIYPGVDQYEILEELNYGDDNGSDDTFDFSDMDFNLPDDSI